MELVILMAGIVYGLIIGLIPAAGATTGLITLFGFMPYFVSDPYLGVQHEKPEARWIEFFAWNVPFIIDLAQQLKLKILDIRDDTNQRKYFIYRKV